MKQNCVRVHNNKQYIINIENIRFLNKILFYEDVMAVTHTSGNKQFARLEVYSFLTRFYSQRTTVTLSFLLLIPAIAVKPVRLYK